VTVPNTGIQLNNNVMSVGSVLSRAWKVLWLRPKLFFGLFLLPFVPAFIIGILLAIISGNFFGSNADITQSLDATGFVIAMVIVAVLLVPIFLICQVAILRSAIGVLRGELISGKQMLKFSQSKAFGFFGLNLLVGLVVVLGLIALIIPGLVFLYWFYLAQYVYVDQNVGILEAIKQSKQLVRGYASIVIGLFLIIFAISLIAGFVPVLGNIVALLFSLLAVIAYADIYNNALIKNKRPPTPVTAKINSK
jgi:hypothetical protein